MASFGRWLELACSTWQPLPVATLVALKVLWGTPKAAGLPASPIVWAYLLASAKEMGWYCKPKRGVFRSGQQDGWGSDLVCGSVYLNIAKRVDFGQDVTATVCRANCSGKSVRLVFSREYRVVIEVTGGENIFFCASSCNATVEKRFRLCQPPDEVVPLSS